jgi:hypothetical protein
MRLNLMTALSLLLCVEVAALWAVHGNSCRSCGSPKQDRFGCLHYAGFDIGRNRAIGALASGRWVACSGR